MVPNENVGSLAGSLNSVVVLPVGRVEEDPVEVTGVCGFDWVAGALKENVVLDANVSVGLATPLALPFVVSLEVDCSLAVTAESLNPKIFGCGSLFSASLDAANTGLATGSVLVSVLAAEAVSPAGVVTELLLEAVSGNSVD